MMPMEIAPKIYDVGVTDWTVRDFHGYKTERGASYNSYLIMDEKICLIDTVKACYADELLEKISRVVDPARIDYVIVNHVEPDHAGALPQVLKAAPNAKFVITMQGKNEALRHYGDGFDFMVVKEGDSIELGSRSLTFVPVPMLHWPDNMVTYCPQDKILFSNDAFGQHYAASKRFDDEVDEYVLFYEAKKYFANILWPYARLIGGALKKVGALDIKMIAPAHGVIWRSMIDKIIERYAAWGNGVKDGSLVIVYDTMWGGTEALARAMVEGAAAAGVKVQLMRTDRTPGSTIAVELFEASGLLVGSPTLNSGMMPSVGGTLVYLKGLQPKGKKAAAFGTCGWAGGAQKDMEALLTAAGFDVQPGYNCKWRASGDEEEAARKFAYEFAKNL